MVTGDKAPRVYARAQQGATRAAEKSQSLPLTAGRTGDISSTESYSSEKPKKKKRGVTFDKAMVGTGKLKDSAKHRSKWLRC